MSNSNEIVLGIDLGTSNSAACIFKDGKTTIVPSAEGASIYGKAFPSYVAVTKEGNVLVGEPAKRQSVTNPEGTVTAIKRKMGTDYTVDLHGKIYSPQEISAMILQKIKTDAESFLGQDIEKAVITVPAYFNDIERTATKDAAEIAGLNVLRLISEPTAASLAYGIDKITDEDINILVFDLGGGTLDVTIMEFGDGVFEVQATSGDTKLGGIDMDNFLISFLAEEFEKEHDIDLLENPEAERRLRESAEKAKIELSSLIETDINIPFIALDSDGSPLNLITKITQAKLESLVRPIVNKCGDVIDKALDVADMDVDEIDKVILVGGPTRMPIVQKFVEDYTHKEIERGIDPMECVAQGASILGEIIERPQSPGAGRSEGPDGVPVNIGSIIVIDRTPFDLGTKVSDGTTAVLIKENSEIPIKRTDRFTTTYDNQTVVRCEAVQGPYKMADDNDLLGFFDLTGIPPARRGVPQIDVTFELDENQILKVTAKELATGKEKNMTITSGLKLTKEEIAKKRKEFEENKEADEKRKNLAKLINEAQRAINSAEDFVNDEAILEKLDGDVIEDIKALIFDLKEAIVDEKTLDIKLKTKDLNNALSDASSILYNM